VGRRKPAVECAKPEQAVVGGTSVKRSRFIQISGGTKSVNRELERKARALVMEADAA